MADCESFGIIPADLTSSDWERVGRLTRYHALLSCTSAKSAKPLNPSHVQQQTDCALA